jgi:hypothetical protein
MMHQLDLFSQNETPTQGVRILLERMKTNPDEFYVGSDKWDWLCGPLVKFGFKEEDRNKIFVFIGLTTAEVQMLYDAFVKASRDNFTSKVLGSLTES